MKMFVTGSAGFIGSHLVEALLNAGHDIKALVRYNSRGAIGHLAFLPDKLRSRLTIVYGDIRDSEFIERHVQQDDTVFHLAALIGIPYSYHAPRSYLQTNIEGTLSILEACRKKNARRLIVTSTSEVYGTAIYSPIDENHPLQGQSPYSATKIAADKLAESYYRSFDLPVVTFRPFNTYGPRQSARAILPTIISQVLGGKNPIRLGSLTPQRDLTFVTDTVDGFLRAAQVPGIEGQVFHIGQGRAVSMKELAETVFAVLGKNVEIQADDARVRPEKSEVGLLLCQPEKATRILGWKPQVSLEEGIRRTAEFIHANLGDYALETYSV
jgi:NAD dependent epimerase/dehydratase